jgi:hypothetical protein
VAVGDILVARDALADAMDCLASEEEGKKGGSKETVDGESRRLRSSFTDSVLLELTLQNHGGCCSLCDLGWWDPMRCCRHLMDLRREIYPPTHENPRRFILFRDWFGICPF